MKKVWRYFIPGGVFLIAMAVVLFTTAKGSAQEQTVAEISNRLEQRSVPVKKVMVVSRVPFDIEIDITSASSDRKLTITDNWNTILANREAALANRRGMNINSYTLNLYNSKGELINSEKQFLSPEISAQAGSGQMVLKLDAITTQNLIKQELNLTGLTLTTLNITNEKGISNGGQVLEMVVTSPDLQSANRAMPMFMPTFMRTIYTFNDAHPTNIVLTHLQITDSGGNVLLDFVRDMEIGKSQWTQAAGFYQDWFPHPPEEIKSTSTPSPLIPSTATATPAAKGGYPPVPTPTKQIYP